VRFRTGPLQADNVTTVLAARRDRGFLRNKFHVTVQRVKEMHAAFDREPSKPLHPGTRRHTGCHQLQVMPPPQVFRLWSTSQVLAEV
jgi:hypothetical protein